MLLAVPADAAGAGDGLLWNFWRDWRIPFFYAAFLPLIVTCLAGVGWRHHWRRLRAGEYRRPLLAAALYTLLGVIFAWPLLAHCRDQIVNWGDALYLSYVFQHHLDHLAGPWANYFDAPIFYPLTENALARSEHIFGAFLMLSPVLLTTQNPVLGINLMVLASFILCGWFAYLWLRDALGDETGALLGGLLFGFCAYRTAHIPRPQMVSCEFLPLCLLFFDCYAKRRRVADLWRFTLACAMQMLMGGYWIVFMVYTLGAYCAVQCIRYGLWRDRRAWLLLPAAALWLALINAPWLEPYFALSRVIGDPWTLAEIQEMAAKGSHYFCTPQDNWLYGAITRAHENTRPGLQEGFLFCGITAMVLVLLGCWTRLAGKPAFQSTTWNRRLLAVDAGIVLLTIFFLYPLLTNDFYLGLPGGHGLHLPRLKMLFAACLLAGAARMILVWRISRKEETSLYNFDAQAILLASLVLILFLFAFGPEINLGHHVWKNPVYLFAHDWLPGIVRMRAVARVFFFILLFGAWFTAAGWMRLVEIIASARLRALTALLIGLLMFLEGAAMPLPGWNYHPPELPRSLSADEMPDGYRELRAMQLEPAVVMLPIHKFWYDPYYLHTQHVHGLTLANGYSGYMPSDYEQFRQAMATFPAEPALRAMQKRGVNIAVLHRPFVSARRWKEWIEGVNSDRDFTVLYQGRDLLAVRWDDGAPAAQEDSATSVPNI